MSTSKEIIIDFFKKCKEEGRNRNHVAALSHIAHNMYRNEDPTFAQQVNVIMRDETVRPVPKKRKNIGANVGTDRREYNKEGHCVNCYEGSQETVKGKTKTKFDDLDIFEAVEKCDDIKDFEVLMTIRHENNLTQWDLEIKNLHNFYFQEFPEDKKEDENPQEYRRKLIQKMLDYFEESRDYQQKLIDNQNEIKRRMAETKADRDEIKQLAGK